MKEISLPFFNDRRTKIDTLMYHCSAHHTHDMIATLKHLELSCHYIIDTDGTITKIVPEDKRAWHGGIGYWRHIKTDINSHSIGIELSSLSLGQEPYPKQQIDSLIKLSKEIIHRYRIKPHNIIGHSDSAPTRKPDPGQAFPWKRLARNHIGLWYNLKEAPLAPTNDLKKLLKGIGYDTRTPQSFAASQYAFARRFLPDLIPENKDIHHLVDNVYPPDIDFRRNKKFIKTAQAVFVRFNP